MGEDAESLTAAVDSSAGFECVFVGLASSARLLTKEPVNEFLNLSKDEHVLHTVFLPSGSRVHLVYASDRISILYAAYSFVEKALGVKFALSGDVIPSRSIPLMPVPKFHVKMAPLFAMRGLQPFHDFAEGPDWWNYDDYKNVITQLSKLKMNFIGLHTYPYSAEIVTGTDEPTVWVGLIGDVNEDGSVSSSYPTNYANTLRNEWGMTPMNTSSFYYGAQLLYESECYGSPVQANNCPAPTTMQGSNEVFDATADLLNSSFTHAHTVGVSTCVGTETPLTPPQGPTILLPLNLYRSPLRNDSFVTTTDCAECDNFGYLFVEIEGYVNTYPCEGCYALNTYFNGKDNILSPTQPAGYSFIRTECYVFNESSNGTTPLYQYYNPSIGDHFAAGSAAGIAYAQAHGYLLQGLLGYVYLAGPSTQDFYEGIFTRIERAYPIDYYWIWTPEAWEWGQMNASNPVFQQAVDDLEAALSAHDAVNASFEMMTCGWVLGPLPDRSIFDKMLPTQYAAITSIDMDVGNTPVDPSYLNVTRHNKWAIPWMEDDPGLTAPELWLNRTMEHMQEAFSYGCEGLLGIHWRTGITAPQITAMGEFSWNSSLTSDIFWGEWALSMFGPEASTQIAAIFNSIDSYNLPRPVNWINGPGGFQPDITQCGAYHTKYGFVDNLAELQDMVQGPLEQERFSYWLNSFLYMRQIAAFECAWAEYNASIAYVKAQPSSQQQSAAQNVALPARITLVANGTLLLSYLLPTVMTRGEMGTVRNVLAHSLVNAIEANTAQLETFLRAPLPANAMPQPVYIGTPKILVPVARSTVHPGETLQLQAILLMNGAWEAGETLLELYVRPLGQGAYTVFPMEVLTTGRGVCQAAIPPQGEDFEYYIGTASSVGEGLVWPAVNTTQTVVIQDN